MKLQRLFGIVGLPMFVAVGCVAGDAAEPDPERAAEGYWATMPACGTNMVQLDGVYVKSNGPTTPDGYNSCGGGCVNSDGSQACNSSCCGLKWQCVEFVNRYNKVKYGTPRKFANAGYDLCNAFNADSNFYVWGPGYKNGATYPAPQKGDIFNQQGSGGIHTGIIAGPRGTDGLVPIADQNVNWVGYGSDYRRSAFPVNQMVCLARHKNAGASSSSGRTRGDVTGDGRADLVSVANGNAYVWPGLSTGGFGAAVASFSGTLDSAMLDGSGHAIKAVSDVTGDGRADLVSTRNGSAYVWPGLSTGGFGGAVSSFSGTLSGAARVVGVADVTGDGRADLVATLYGTAYVWPGQTNGSFGSSTASFSGTLGSTILIVGVADVNGDGRADLVGRGGGTIYVWPGQTNGAFGGYTQSFSGTLDSTHYIVDVSDVNGDGRADLVSINSNRNAYVWPGTSTGAFGSAVASFNGTLNASNVDGVGHYIVGVADVTGDGRGDLLSVNPDGNAYVWPGTASLGFGAAISSFNGTLNTSNKDRDGGHYIVGPSGRVL